MQVYLFEICSKRQFFLNSQRDLFGFQKIISLLRTQSADRKTLGGLQRAETHFFAQVIFENIIILNLAL
jgi:hypothetical protein